MEREVSKANRDILSSFVAIYLASPFIFPGHRRPVN